MCLPLWLAQPDNLKEGEEKENKTTSNFRNVSEEFSWLNTLTAVRLHENNPLVAAWLLGGSSVDFVTAGGPPQQLR